ncbi:MAG: NAD-dependent epimerase/dehydratase family protein [Pseudomonadota bacterium]
MTLLFGQGLVGHAVAASLAASAPDSQRHSQPYDWYSAAARADIRKDLARHVAAAGARVVSIVWAAGRAGFGATETDMAAEDVAFTEIVAFGQALEETGCRVALHLVSSAGGLFEGQSHVGLATLPAPQRPYGHAKLAQEAALMASGLEASIYRLSSVYGYLPGGRLGLISTLMLNALEGRVTPITGHMDTRRDYVLAADTGAFIAGCIMRGDNGHDPFLLASGQSASIVQILEAVQAALGEVPLDLDLAEAPNNAADMSFDPAALPAGWEPTPLTKGIAQTLMRIRTARAGHTN